MKMIIFFTSIFLLFSAQAFTQYSGTSALESYYDFTLNGSVGEHTQNVIDPVFVINARLCVIRNDRFCLVYLDEMSISNKSMGNTGNEEKRDSILFDLTNQIAYNFSNKRSYRFKVRNYQSADLQNASIKIISSDTTIILKRELDRYSSPSPTIGLFPFGISSYSTKMFSFQYNSSKESDVDLVKVFKIVNTFPLSPDNLPFAF